MKHDDLCRQRYQPWEKDNDCSDCQLISKVREDEMTKYVQLRESTGNVEVDEFLSEDSLRRTRLVTDVANGLFAAWFPEYPKKGPVGEDLENWKQIAIGDAVVAVQVLMRGAWIDDPTMD